jgi:uncharacterized membrane protein
MTRLETFTDAAFAFAVTLLVIGGGDAIPRSFEEMQLAMKQVPAFAASFLNIIWFWYAHHVWSRRFGLDDRISILLSLLLVFVVLIYVYPLKAVYSGALDYFSGGYFGSYFRLESAADLRSMFVIFGSGFAALSLLTALLNVHAWALRDALSLSAVERFHTVSVIQYWAIAVVVPIGSILLALTLPDTLVVVAGMIYAVFAPIFAFHGLRRARALERLKR